MLGETLLFTTYFLARESDLEQFHKQYLKRVDKAREITQILYVTDEITHGGDGVIREVMMQDFRRDMRDFGTYPFDESEWGLYNLSCVAKDVDEPAMEGAGVRLPSFSGHPISADFVSVREDVHCESTTPEIHT